MNNIERLRKLALALGYDSPTCEEVIDLAQALDDLNGGTGYFDFSVDGCDWRAIHGNDIDQIMMDELESDEYMIGCCASWLLADILNLPIDAVELLQRNEQFEALGQMVTANPERVRALQGEIAKHDGYGPHFSSYDGEQRDFEVYCIFKVG